MHKERRFRAPPKRAPEIGASHGYQRGPQRRAWDAKAAAAATKKPVCEHRSLSTPPLPGACAARHRQGPVIQGQLPQENTRCASGCCNVMPASATAGLPRTPYPSLPPAWVSQSPWISCSFNPILSGWWTDARGWPTCRGRAKSKAEPQELWEQRREREISPSSLRSSGLNLHNQLDVPASLEYLNRQQIIPKLRWWTFGATVYLGFAVCDWLVSDFYVSLSIVFSTCYHWWICLLVWLLSSFF